MKSTSFSVRRISRDEHAYRELVDATRATPNGEIEDIDRTIAAYERKYRLSSAEALVAIERGELKASREVEGWMMALRVRDHLVSVKARAR